MTAAAAHIFPVRRSGHACRDAADGAPTLQERIDSLPEGMSCFNPNHYEQVINRLIFKMGPENPTSAKRVAPVNWRTEVKNGCLWLYYEIHKAEDGDPESFAPSLFSSYAVTPLDDHHYIRLMFHKRNQVDTKKHITSRQSRERA